MRGVTQADYILRHLLLLFQLTRLMRGVTCCNVVEPVLIAFQLTRLMRGVT